MQNNFFEKTSISIIFIISILIIIMGLFLSKFNVELFNSIINQNREDTHKLLSLKKEENINLMNENIKFIANLISANSAELLYDMEQQMIFNTLKSFMKIKEIVAIEVYDSATNGTFASFWKDENINSSVKLPKDLNLKDTLFYITDINYKNQKIGTLKIYYTDKYILEELDKLQENTILKLETFERNIEDKSFKYYANQIIILILFLVIINFVAIKSMKILKNKLQSSKKEILEKNEKLKNLNKNLEERVKNTIREVRKKDELLLRQSKMASMGEMLGSIAHQWRQPLNALGLIIQRLEVEYLFNKSLDEKIVNSVVNDSMEQIEFMSKTIDDFRNFFKLDKERVKFSVIKVINESVRIVSAQLDNHHIKLSIEGSDFEIMGYPNEFGQVILNILNNAKDALLETNNREKNIQIEVLKNVEKDIGIICIKDNAKGFKDDLNEKIFEPYFTTKHQVHGTGIGLYMSKMIIEHNMNGKIYARNISEPKVKGAEFIIELPLLDY